MNRLEGKVVIITGASGGLGKQMALRFAQEGAKLAICARREKKLQETKDLCQQAGAQVLAMVADVSHHDELKAFVEKTAETFGTIDVLVNNASTISAPHQRPGGGPSQRPLRHVADDAAVLPLHEGARRVHH